MLMMSEEEKFRNWNNFSVPNSSFITIKKSALCPIDKMLIDDIYYIRREYCDSSYALMFSLKKDNRPIERWGGYFFMANINNKIKVKIIIMYSIIFPPPLLTVFKKNIAWGLART